MVEPAKLGSTQVTHGLGGNAEEGKNAGVVPVQDS